jgi:hypothetical protein
MQLYQNGVATRAEGAERNLLQEMRKDKKATTLLKEMI